MRAQTTSAPVGYAWLAVATALLTMALKAAAWLVTGSVGLLADAAESIINLVAAVLAVVALSVAARPADHNHHFGHTKAEYFSAAVEGILIVLAAAAIVISAVRRLLLQAPLEQLGVGAAITVAASAANALVGMLLMRAAGRHHSVALRAEGVHLLTDVATSAGVLLGLGAYWFTGWLWVDPVVAVVVAVHIATSGAKLLRQATVGLMDGALPEQDNKRLAQLLSLHSDDGIEFHAVRTRQSGSRQFMEMHMLVPGTWSVKRGHDAMEDLIEQIQCEFPRLAITGHLEPIEDPRSYEDA